ncbi:hypothetical protein [Bradyrhizobium betae]|uniref:Uncharacterized protein n=1 Tax=Bradyrhizobium betae TaxID=244734 RepID=A0A5P6P930_9BRAD|nr:hypothetical protein [Bradyrhizobium betae]MCS3727296.1 hypothetical protein [Bradyrhizobium betae]QFI74802.1 hypothetical protein F8237_21765 [Bradyrhizobium betae]
MLREMHGSSWRREGQRLFDLKRGQLRAHIDNPDHPPSIRMLIENKLVAAMRKQAKGHRDAWIAGIERAKKVEVAFWRRRDPALIDMEQLLALQADDRRRCERLKQRVAGC